MTVTKRKQKPRETGGSDPLPSGPPTLESGIKASCDSCSADITHSVHVRCAEKHQPPNSERLTCPDFDLCVDCFLHGKSLGPHRPTHAYRIISSHSFPIFTQLWGADEELLLIEGAQMYGLGNWADISEHVGGRTKEECKEHYETTYLNSDEWPEPIVESNFSPTDLDTFASLKKTRLEILQSRPLPLPPPKPLASAPTCHEIGGYMPARLEFEHEYENEAEVLIKDLEFGKVYHFGGEDQPAAPPPPPPPPIVPPAKEKGEEEEEVVIVEGQGGEEKKPLNQEERTTEDHLLDEVKEEEEGELELKMSILEMFNEKYDKRMAAKDLIFDRGLINYKTLSASERKRSKDERDLITRTKVFARIQTSTDHEEFIDGLLYEITLRKRIAELQDYRRNGITTLSQATQYDHSRTSRLSQKAASYRESISLSFDRSSSSTNLSSSQNRPKPSTTSSTGGGGITFTSSSSTKRPPLPPLTLATSSSLSLLTPLEKELCSTLRMLPKPYLFLKGTLMREWVRLKIRMNGREAKRVVGLKEDEEGEWGEKVERVWEFLREGGGLREPQTNRVEEGEEDLNGDGDEEMDSGNGNGNGNGNDQVGMEIET